MSRPERSRPAKTIGIEWLYQPELYNLHDHPGEEANLTGPMAVQIDDLHARLQVRPCTIGGDPEAGDGRRGAGQVEVRPGGPGSSAGGRCRAMARS